MNEENGQNKNISDGIYNKLYEIQSLLKKESSLRTLCKYYP